MTRVLLIHQPIDGGVARHIADLYAGLRADGFDVILCGPAVPLALRSATAAPAQHAALALQRAVAPRADLPAVKRLAEIVRALRPDIVHAHSSKAGAVARLARLVHPRTPVLYTPHGYAMAGFFEHRLERLAYGEAERSLGLLTSRVIAVCEAEARLARRVMPANRVRVVHNGIDPVPPGPADPRVLELAGRGPVVCAVSRLQPGKGLETLIDAWPETIAGSPKLQLALVGDGSLRASLQARVRDRGVEASVHFLGEYADPMSALRAADVFVFPSWVEAFPYAILEAMSMGLPIVSSNVGGVGEALVDGDSGLLVPARRPDALAAALLTLLGDAELRARVGVAAKEAVGRRFTRQSMMNGVASVYRELVG